MAVLAVAATISAERASPLGLEATPRTPAVTPVDEVACPYVPAMRVLAANPRTTAACAVVAVDVPTTPARPVESATPCAPTVLPEGLVSRAKMPPPRPLNVPPNAVTEPLAVKVRLPAMFWLAMNAFVPSVAAVPAILLGVMLAPAAILASVTELAPSRAFVTPPLAIPSVTPPLVPPPVRPVPAVTPVIGPPFVPSPALVITVPSVNTSALPAPLIFTFPATSNFCEGVVVPNPTFPPFGSVTTTYRFYTVPAPPGDPMYPP